jgi:CheY-like chemotaxis protein
MIIPRQILHVDDDPELTSLVAEYLKDYGYSTTAFHDPTEVIKQLPKFQERIILLDIDMPQMNGLDLLREIKHFDGSILVVMLTGLVTMTSVLQAMRWGAEACFFKPISDVNPLVEALNDCFRKVDRWWIALDELSHQRRADVARKPAESLTVGA